MDEIGDFMSSPVLTVDSESTVQEAAQFMHSHNIGAVIVSKYAFGDVFIELCLGLFQVADLFFRYFELNFFKPV